MDNFWWWTRGVNIYWLMQYLRSDQSTKACSILFLPDISDPVFRNHLWAAFLTRLYLLTTILGNEWLHARVPHTPLEHLVPCSVGQNYFTLISSTCWQILSLLNVIFKSLYTALSSSPLCWKSVLGDTTVFWNFISMICCIPNPWPGLLRTMPPCLHFPGCFFISLGFSLLPLWT